jgi:hypothetical protein
MDFWRDRELAAGCGEVRVLEDSRARPNIYRTQSSVDRHVTHVLDGRGIIRRSASGGIIHWRCFFGSKRGSFPTWSRDGKELFAVPGLSSRRPPIAARFEEQPLKPPQGISGMRPFLFLIRQRIVSGRKSGKPKAGFPPSLATASYVFNIQTGSPSGRTNNTNSRCSSEPSPAVDLPVGEFRQPTSGSSEIRRNPTGW